jgi:hypothetical protein
MTLDEVKKYFTNSYQFQKKTGMMHNNFMNWEKQGFVPIKTQLKLQQLTKGELKASLEHIIQEI